MYVNVRGLMFHGMVLLAGYCFGGVTGLGVAAAILAVLLMIF